MTVIKQRPANSNRDTSTGHFPPGSTIGLLGSGQLGRMFSQAAQQMGYRVHVYSDESDSPAGQVADREFAGDFSDRDRLVEFARGCDVISLEFENVPVKAVELVAEQTCVRPAASVLYTVQHRLREKEFLSSCGISCAPFQAIRSLSDLEEGLTSLGYPAVLKTASDGYDGKGQFIISSPEDIEKAFNDLASDDLVLEGFVELEHEFSMLAARGVDGLIATYRPIANMHKNHILDVSVLPLPALENVAESAKEIAHTIVEELEVVGIICVEFFLTASGELLVNEIAPRPHNSGHLTIDACITSQFEQQVRAVCGIPLGSTDQLRPAAMANLLGHLWEHGEPNWSPALELSGVSLHLYGKTFAREGRKMGHLTALANTSEEAEQTVREARDRLSS